MKRSFSVFEQAILFLSFRDDVNSFLFRKSLLSAYFSYSFLVNLSHPPTHTQVLQGLRAGVSDLKALQGRAQVEEGQSIGESVGVHDMSKMKERGKNGKVNITTSVVWEIEGVFTPASQHQQHHHQLRQQLSTARVSS